ncbi:hypothetical protein ACNKHO_07605 [Shigella flexneri]
MAGHADSGLKPVMTLSSEIIGIQNLKAGDRVGYGSRIAQRKNSVLVLWPGLCRRLSAYPQRHAGGVDGIAPGR